MADALRAAAHITVKGAEPWRFADRCAGENLTLRNVRLRDEFTLAAELPLRELERARRLAEHCGCELKLETLSALPRTGRKIFRHRFLLAAFAVMFSLLLAASLFVWDVEVAENDSEVPDTQILRTLDAQGVGVGSFWPAFRGERIRTKALLALPQLRFLTVNVRGGRAYVKARAAVPAPEIFDPQEKRDITAARSGVIRSAVVLAGEARAGRGDAVTAGQTLIAGTPEAPHARGEIVAYTYRESTAAAPLFEERTGDERRLRRRFALILGTKRINFYRNSRIPPDECDRITQVRTLQVGDLFSLPVRFVRETVMPLQHSGAELSEAVVMSDLQKTAAERIQKQTGPDGEVLAEHWSVSTDGQWVRVTLRCECQERIDAETPPEEKR